MNPTEKYEIEKTTPNMLLTGSLGMLGSYIIEIFKGWNITGLNRGPSANGITCDLSKNIPALPIRYDLVVHTAGTTDEASAIDVNLNGTKNLLAALEKNPPKEFIYISDAAVYGLSGAEDIDETANTWATDKVGQSKILAEKEVSQWAEKHDVLLTILRPAMMFGSGISGKGAALFEDVIHSRYIHIRGNDARRGIVTAYDVAKAAFMLHDKGGIYNVADGFNRTFLELVNAMDSNAGTHKRMIFLPPKWAKLGAKIPGLKRILNPETLKNRAVTLTYSNAKLIAATGMKMFDTVEVIAGCEPDFPYRDR
ncbi:MAG: NAD(P)-dependent oxidoreductase [Prevotella sp.]|nr:NAD(P)-dependent oxidoreductase [Bacteroides sp.]MCM1366481.1 NAD(P)-dependent oxidoreductase [Prevotella sp.]MCM1436820.1 NAD(P)-dependent oxidoreductase [Prevotella sp.]